MKYRILFIAAFALAAILVVVPSLFAGGKVRTVFVHVEPSSFDGRFPADNLMDGDMNTFWHSRVSRNHEDPFFHELLVDLAGEFELDGVSICQRNDMWSGAVKSFELFCGNDPKHFGEPVIKAELKQTRGAQEFLFKNTKKARYILLRATEPHIAKPWASLAELTPLSREVRFRSKPLTGKELMTESLGGDFDLETEPAMQYGILLENLRDRARFDRIAAETFHPASLILPEDRDPLDIVLRRMRVALEDIVHIPGAPDLAEQAKLLDSLAKKAKAIAPDRAKERYGLYLEACSLRRKILFSNPLLDFNEIVFLKKHRGRYNHMCDQFYGVNLPPGGGLFSLSDPFSMDASVNGPEKTGRVRNILENSRVSNGRLQGQRPDTGAFATLDLSYDGSKIAFAYVECRGDSEHRHHVDPSKGHWHEGRCFHIFTVNVDGTELTQLTDGTWNDFDPCFLPNGRMAFISERRNGYLRCGRVCPTFTLFDMDQVGGRIRCLSYHETNEWNPSVSHDGKILYTRWDYIDREACIAHHPWITSLDGCDARAVHGNFTEKALRADMELGCRAIPDSGRFVAVAAPHHGQAYGSLLIVDPKIDDNDHPMAPVRRITPEIDFPESQKGAQVYGMPYPLSEKYYLAVADFAVKNEEGREGRQYFRGDYGIYLVDVFGNKELLYRDPEVGCASPTPLRPRNVPLFSPSFALLDEIEHQPFVAPYRGDSPPMATVSVVDVYQSLRPWPAGTKIKELRIVQILPMTVPSGRPPHEIGFREPSALNSVLPSRYVLGTVPVEEDGSAFFMAPANKEILFQAVDEEGLAVQSMRSGTYFKEGEVLACTGCHEPKSQSAPVLSKSTPKAFRRAPSRIKPDVPEANPFSYPLLVQPILDKHCVQCHAEAVEKGAENVPNLAREPVEGKWYASYRNLVPKYGFYDYKESLRTTPGKFGAKASVLYRLLKEGHHDVELAPDELHRIVLWLDCLSPFYGVYEKEGGEAQLRGEVVYPTLE